MIQTANSTLTYSASARGGFVLFTDEPTKTDYGNMFLAGGDVGIGLKDWFGISLFVVHGETEGSLPFEEYSSTYTNGYGHTDGPVNGRTRSIDSRTLVNVLCTMRFGDIEAWKVVPFVIFGGGFSIYKESYDSYSVRFNSGAIHSYPGYTQRGKRLQAQAGAGLALKATERLSLTISIGYLITPGEALETGRNDGSFNLFGSSTNMGGPMIILGTVYTFGNTPEVRPRQFFL